MTTPEKKIVTPTVGRKVWFRPNGVELPLLVNAGGILPARPSIYGSQPLDATVVYVWGRLVNLAVIDHDGNHFTATSVPLLQEGDEKPASGFYCEWTPYQTAQAKKESAVPMAPPLAYPATRRENIEQILVSGAATAIAANPANAGKIADAINAALNSIVAGQLTPDFRSIHKSMDEMTARVMSGGEFFPDPNTMHADGSAADPEHFGVTVIDAKSGIGMSPPWDHGEAPRVTKEMVDAQIVDETYTVLPSGRVTVCELTLKNGFTVRGESAVVFIENNVPATGREVARENAVGQIWQLLGYALREKHCG